MFMRLVEAVVREGKGPALESVYRDSVIPVLEKTGGCIFAGLLQSVNNSGQYASLTLWQSEKSIQDYNESGSFEKNLEYVRPFLEESTEWKIQLTKESAIEYVPVKQEPIVKSYPVESDDENLSEGIVGDRKYLRVLSLKIKTGQEEEFKQIYKNDIQTALRETPGCRFSFLVDNSSVENEFLSLTIWDDLESVKLYEDEGEFSSLLKMVSHTLAELYQWKMALESKSKSKYSVTSKDLDISKFTMVTGKKFDSQ